MTSKVQVQQQYFFKNCTFLIKETKDLICVFSTPWWAWSNDWTTPIIYSKKLNSIVTPLPWWEEYWSSLYSKNNSSIPYTNSKIVQTVLNFSFKRKKERIISLFRGILLYRKKDKTYSLRDTLHYSLKENNNLVFKYTSVPQ